MIFRRRKAERTVTEAEAVALSALGKASALLDDLQELADLISETAHKRKVTDAKSKA